MGQFKNHCSCKHRGKYPPPLPLFFPFLTSNQINKQLKNANKAKQLDTNKQCDVLCVQANVTVLRLQDEKAPLKKKKLLKVLLLF